jgi:pyridoxine 5'-phosphate synthase PdxJ
MVLAQSVSGHSACQVASNGSAKSDACLQDALQQLPLHLRDDKRHGIEVDRPALSQDRLS